MFKQKKSVLILSIVVLSLSIFASLGGLLLPNVYNDSPTFVLIWKSNDLITLVVAIPILILSIVSWYRHHLLKSLLVWYSILWYLIYNYSYYVFGAAFNDLYLIHLFIYTISIGAILLALTSFPISDLNLLIKAKFKRKIVISQLLFVAIGLTIIYVMQSLAYVLSDTLPAIIIASGHVTSVVFTIDFSMVVLFFVLGAILLIKKNPWGYLIAFLGNLKGVIYMGVLTLASLRTNPAEAVIWITHGVLSLISIILLFNGLNSKKIPSTN